MENLVINNTINTPQVNLNAKTGELSIKGSSTAENPLEYFNPIMAWLKDYYVSPVSVTTVNIFPVHFNTVSTKCLLLFLRKMKTISDMGNKVVIKWHYEEDDEDMLDMGEEYANVVELPFEFIAEKEFIQEIIEEDYWIQFNKKLRKKENTAKLIIILVGILAVAFVLFEVTQILDAFKIHWKLF